jgi:hypothetical protein
MLEKVKLNKQNQIDLMQDIKLFIGDWRTKKKAFKLIAKIVEKYEIENDISEIV